MSSSKIIYLWRDFATGVLSEFIDWRYSYSRWYFRPSFVDYFTSNLLSGSPPPLPVSKCSPCLGRGVGVLYCILLETIFCRSLTFCIWPDSEPTKLQTSPNKNLGGDWVPAAKSLYRSSVTRYFKAEKVSLLRNVYFQLGNFARKIWLKCFCWAEDSLNFADVEPLFRKTFDLRLALRA